MGSNANVLVMKGSSSYDDGLVPTTSARIMTMIATKDDIAEELPPEMPFALMHKNLEETGTDARHTFLLFYQGTEQAASYIERLARKITSPDRVRLGSEDVQAEAFTCRPDVSWRVCDFVLDGMQGDWVTHTGTWRHVTARSALRSLRQNLLAKSHHVSLSAHAF